jgi:hypothetical protein
MLLLVLLLMMLVLMLFISDPTREKGERRGGSRLTVRRE